MPGLGASFGRGAATTHLEDLANSDCILIMGSNMAEAHPVGFRFPMMAREKGATLIHVDPRFSRTSAMCNEHVQIRAGTDIAFLGGIIRYILEHDRWFKEYVLAYTNASTIIEEGFEDTEDLDGLFSGYDKEHRSYESVKGNWAYESAHKLNDPKQKIMGRKLGAGQEKGGAQQGTHGYAAMGGASSHRFPRGSDVETPAGDPPRDETLQHERCVMQLLRKHYARYTPQMVAEICGCEPSEVERVAELLCANSGRERTSAICYAVGWTQHTTGVQMIRAAGIIQLLLGNIGRPGGGIMALRGHCSIQGSTDIPTLYDLLPGYLPQPLAAEGHEKLDSYCHYESFTTGYWANFKKFMVSFLKAWYGDAATPENEFGYGWLPKIDDDYSQLSFFDMMARGQVKGYFVMGQNPAGGGPNAWLHRAGLRQLDWLVVCDWFMQETATFWKHDPKGPAPNDIKTEVFFMPAAVITEKEGCFTNTNRLLQWHDKCLDPPHDCRSDSWFVYNLGKRLKKLYADSDKPQDQAIKYLTWDYEHDHLQILPDGTPTRIAGEPAVEKILKEINGYDLSGPEPRLLKDFQELKDDGSTACGCWIYAGVYPEPDHNRARSRTNDPTKAVQLDWGFSWPHNRRIMYNRASADPAGKPWSERKKYMQWDPEQKKWTGPDEVDFVPDKAPDYEPDKNATGMDAIGGADPFIMKPDGRGWIFSPATKDGPFPTHYEPVESPVRNKLYQQQDSPVSRYMESERNPLAHGPEDEYPIVACTFRLTEHYLSGPMSRFNSWLNELQPEMFAEISPELAVEKGIDNGAWMVVSSPRGSIEVKALVTPRMKMLKLNGRSVHQIGLPFHWGYAGEAVGAIANDLTSAVLDPNVSIHEGKVFTVQVRAGRMPGTANLQPTERFAPRPMREAIPQTPPAAQPEGRIQP